jgi:hypothetical protein
MMEVMLFELDVEYYPGNGTLMAVPDALSRDTMDRTLLLCQNFLGSKEVEEVREVSDP